MPGELAEDIGQSSLCVWKLILQCVVMLLFENAARKGLLDEVLDWLQCGRRATDPHNHSVAITKSKKREVIMTHLAPDKKEKSCKQAC